MALLQVTALLRDGTPKELPSAAVVLRMMGAPMSKLRELVSKGVRLVVAETDEAGGAVPAASASKEIPADQFPLAAPDRAPVPVSAVPADTDGFDPVYAEASISVPAHGYGIAKVAEMLENKRLASL